MDKPIRRRRRLPPALPDDIIAEILLRLPPGEPACLFRASVVCVAWRSIVSDPAFLRRYRDFHRTPPLLGFYQNQRLLNINEDEQDGFRRFVPTIDASPIAQPAFDFAEWTALDCRHGRVLLVTPDRIIVWNPITGHLHYLHDVPEKTRDLDYDPDTLTGAVLCAVDGCDHLDCRGGPFRVVFAGADPGFQETVTWARVYSSETTIWTARTEIHFAPFMNTRNVMGPSLLTGDALYFVLDHGRRILRYDLGGDALSQMNPPPVHLRRMFLMTAEDGELGVAGMVGYNLSMWSWHAGADGVPEWASDRFIDTRNLGIDNPDVIYGIVGFAEIAGTVFITTPDSIFTLDKSSNVRKVSEQGNIRAIFPFECFYTPADLD